jgi:hypothetical protein
LRREEEEGEEEEEEEEEERGRRCRRAGAAEAPAPAHGVALAAPGLVPLRRARERKRFFAETECGDGTYF